MNYRLDISDFIETITEQSILFGIKERAIKRRKELKITQKDLAKISGVSYGSIRRFESSGEISLVFLIKIAHALNSMEDFNNLFKYRQITNLKDYFK